MMKKLFPVIFSLCLFFSFDAYAVDFTDVPESSEYHKYVDTLNSLGVITGYGDGTFLPDKSISRAEVSAIAVRVAKLDTDISAKSIYNDVADEFWARKYIMSATGAGILNGIGNGRFSPGTDVTHNQIVKIAVCISGKGELAEKRGGWPGGYIQTAYEHEIITTSEYSNLLYGSLGNSPATRGDVAKYIYRAITIPEKYKLAVGESEYFIGMSAKALPSPVEALQSANEFIWYIYGTDTYENFFAAGVADGLVVALASSAPGFEYNGLRAGDYAEKSEYIYTDQNAGGTIHAVYIINNFYSNKVSVGNEQLVGESRLNFHLTNGFRVQHGLKPLKWDDAVTAASLLHSEDMAKNDYFDHTGLDGSNVAKRLTRQGISWMQCGENIAAGTRNSGFVLYDGLVNSSGHRNNLLGPYTHAGVASAYNALSTYKYYLTQNFRK